MTDWSFCTCVDNADWDDFVSTSEQGTVFTRSAILDVLGDTTEKYFLKKKGRIVAGLPIVLVKGEPLFPVPFCYYQGIILDHSINRLNNVRKFSWITEILTRVANFLITEYGKFGLSFHYSLLDVRALTWIDQGLVYEPTITIVPRYTAILDLKAFHTIEEYSKMIRKDRRQDLKRARKEGLICSYSDSSKKFINLLQQTFDRTGAPLSDLECSIIEKILAISGSNDVGGLVVVEEKSGSIGAGQFFLKDQNSFHAVAHASSYNGREIGASALAHLGLIQLAKKSGSRVVDFNGANSLTRADYKHSWAANPKLFFNISKKS